MDPLETIIALVEIIDVIKDTFYIITFPHLSMDIVFMLWFSLTAPFAIIYTI